MTQAVGQRGVKPPYLMPPAQPKAGATRALPKSTAANAPAMRFGGGLNAPGFLKPVIRTAVDKSIFTFQNITQVFLWGFLAQDVFAMWLPRVWNSLQEGKKPYQPKPQDTDQSFHQQLAGQTKDYLQTLNWGNFWEGFKREFATGPGLLIIPAAIALFNQRIPGVGNPSRELSYDSVNKLGEGFADYLGKAPIRNKADLQDKLSGYIQSLFVDKNLHDPGKEVAKSAQKTLPEIEKFANNMAKHILNPDTAPKGWHETQANTLHEKIRTFNRDILGKESTSTLFHDATPLHQADNTWVAYESKAFTEAAKAATANPNDPKPLGEAKKLLQRKPVKTVAADVWRMRGMAQSLAKKVEKGTHSGLDDAMRGIASNVVRSKFWLAMLTTGTTAAYLCKLAFWAQQGDTYEATRMLRDDAPKANKSETTKRGSESRSHESNASIDPNAGLPFKGQPAFLQSGRLPMPFGHFPATAPYPMFGAQPTPNQTGRLS